jgi:hypothetical protein
MSSIKFEIVSYEYGNAKKIGINFETKFLNEYCTYDHFPNIE